MTEGWTNIQKKSNREQLKAEDSTQNNKVIQ